MVSTCSNMSRGSSRTSLTALCRYTADTSTQSHRENYGGHFNRNELQEDARQLVWCFVALKGWQVSLYLGIPCLF